MVPFSIPGAGIGGCRGGAEDVELVVVITAGEDVEGVSTEVQSPGLVTAEEGRGGRTTGREWWSGRGAVKGAR